MGGALRRENNTYCIAMHMIHYIYAVYVKTKNSNIDQTVEQNDLKISKVKQRLRDRLYAAQITNLQLLGGFGPVEPY